MKKNKQHIIPIIILFIVGISIFYPILSDINLKIPGNIPPNAQDGFQHIWNFWWAKKTCLGFCGDFWYTNYQFFPGGTSLLFQSFSLPNLIIMSPFMFLGLSPVAAFNISLMLAVITSSIGAYALAYYLTKDSKASIISGLIYSISPYMIIHILDGQMNLSTIQFFPLFILFLFKSSDSKKNIHPIIAGLLLFIIGLNDFTLLVFGIIIWIIWFIYKILTEKNNYKDFLKKTLITFIVFLTPFMIYAYNNFKQSSQFSLFGETKWDSEYFSADVKYFITPPETTIIGNKLLDNKYEITERSYSNKNIYLGFTVILLSGLGFFWKRKSLKNINFWLYMFILGFILSLGPKLYFNEKIIYEKMPFILIESIPFINNLKSPTRFTLLVFLSLSILAAYGYMEIKKKIKNKTIKKTFIIIIIFLIIFEYFPFFQRSRVLNIPEGIKKIREDSSSFAIIELPILWMSGLGYEGSAFKPEFLYYQTYHEKKMAGGYITRMKPNEYESYKNDNLLNYYMTQEKRVKDESINQALTTLNKYKTLEPEEILNNNNYKYIIIHRNINNNLYKNIKDILRNNIEKIYSNDELEIFLIVNNE
jgi:hypothetical protein